MLDGNNQELRSFVAVQLAHASLQGVQLIRAGLQEDHGFRSGMDLVLPAVDGLDDRERVWRTPPAVPLPGATEVLGFFEGDVRW